MTNPTKAVYVHYTRVKISNKSFIWLSGVRIFKIRMIMSRKLPLYLLLSKRGLRPKINHFVINVTTHIPCNLHRKPYRKKLQSNPVLEYGLLIETFDIYNNWTFVKLFFHPFNYWIFPLIKCNIFILKATKSCIPR